MTNKTTMQKQTVCIALIVLLFAFVTTFAVVGLNMPTQTAYAYSVGNTFTQGDSYTFSGSVYFYDEVSESTVTLSGELSYTGTEKISNYIIFYFFNLSTETMYSFRALYGDASSVPNSFVIISGSGTSGDPFHINFATRTAPHIHEGVTFTEWTSNSSLPTAAGSYYLTQDVTMTSSWPVDNCTINMCLNGHGIVFTESSYVIIMNDGTLNLYDCGTATRYITTNANGVFASVSDTTSEGTIEVTGGFIAGSTTYAVQTSAGTFNMYGGTVCCNESGVLVSDTQTNTFTMYGGSISYNQMGVKVNQGTFTMEDGTISHNEAKALYLTEGAGVQVYDTFIMNGGTISDNSARIVGGGLYISIDKDGGHVEMNGGAILNNQASSFGGGVYIIEGAFVMNNGLIRGNSAYAGGGVCNMTDGTFTMNGGTIRQNTSEERGGGIHNAATFTMNGGMFKQNHSGMGGAISTGGVFTLTAGSITENVAAYGAGILFGNGEFHISGAPTISGNVDSNDAPTNIYILNESNPVYIMIDDALTNTTPLGVNMHTLGKFTNDDVAAYKDNFTPDDPAHIIKTTAENALTLEIAHIHVLSYTVNGATITATCSAEECPLEDNKATLTINAPTGNLVYGEGVKEATLSVYDVTIFTPEAIVYYKDGVEIEHAPINAGTYVAKVTSNGKTAEVSFTITPSGFDGYSLTLSTDTLTYTGEEQSVAATLRKGSDIPIQEGTDYTLSGNKATEVGEYTVTVTGIGNFAGTATSKYHVVPANIEGMGIDAPENGFDENYIYVVSPWATTYIHYWGNVDGGVYNTWPGVQMESLGNGLFRHAYPTLRNNDTAVYLIFDTNEGSEQTADLKDSKEVALGSVYFVAAKEPGQANAATSFKSRDQQRAVVTMENGANVETVGFAGKTLVENTDYTVSYKTSGGNAIDKPRQAGNYIVVVTGIGNYTGSVEKAFVLKHEHDGVEFTEWNNASSLPTESGNYYLTCDVVLSGSHYFSNNISLCLNGHSITTTGEGAVLVTQFSDSLTFNLYDCDDTEHKYCIHDYVAVVDDSLTENYETFKGGYITGGKNGAVDNYATFNMYGGTLIGNTGSSPAVGSMKVFRMYGGAIIGNYATGMGAAGVGASNSNQDASHIYLYGGKIIENTSAGYGGGVMPGLYTYSKYVVGSLEGHEALIVRDNYALKGTYNQDYYHESNVFVWRSSDHPLITMEFQNSAVTPEIGITIDDTVPGRVFASGEDYPDYYSDSWINYFFSDDLDYEAAINTDSEDYYLDFYLKALPPHVHDFDCSAEGATLTLVCKNTDRRCGLENCTITLTLVAPTMTVQWGEGSSSATIDGYQAFVGATNQSLYVQYYKYGSGEELSGAPDMFGKYTAKITFNGETASVDYEIAEATGYLFVGGVDIVLTEGKRINANTPGLNGTVSGTATFDYERSTGNPVLTLENFVFNGQGYEYLQDEFAAIYCNMPAEKDLFVMIKGENKLTYDDIGFFYTQKEGVRTGVAFWGQGSICLDDGVTDYGGNCAIKCDGSEFIIMGSTVNVNIKAGFVFDGHSLSLQNCVFNGSSIKGKAVQVERFEMIDSEATFVSKREEIGFALSSSRSSMVRGSKLTLLADEAGIGFGYEGGGLNIDGGTITIKGSSCGVCFNTNEGLEFAGGKLFVEGGIYGVRQDEYDHVDLYISDGEVTIIGGTTAIYSDENATVKVYNSIDGKAWTNTEGTEGMTAIAAGESAKQLDNGYKKVRFSSHTHNIVYSVNGATITATCSAEECPLEGNKATLTINAPTGTLIYDGTAKEATLSAYDASAFAPEAIKYYKGETEVASCIDAGDYVAKVTSNGVTAQVSFTIAKATPDYEIPTGLNATYGDAIADVELPEGWAWDEEDTTKVGNVGDREHSATFTPDDIDNYDTVTETLTITVGKAIPDYTVPTGLTSLVDKTLDAVALPTGWTWNAPETNVGNEIGLKTFKATFTPEDTDNYVIIENVDVAVNVSTHAHAFTYTANGATITATCGNAACYVTEGLTLTLVGPIGDPVYNGKARVATIAAGYNNEAFPHATVVYYRGDAVVESCVSVGTYTAKVTFGDATAAVSFTIEPWTCVEEDKGVSVEIEGAEYDEDIIVEVEVRTDVASKQSQIDYSEIIKDNLAANEKIAIVYDVKLIQITVVGGVETKIAIQPDDIKPGTTVLIRMDIPEALRGKEFKLLHIHSANDVEFVENFTISPDGTYLTVCVNRLSDFAFVTTNESTDGDGSAKHGFCIGWIVLIFVILELLYLALYFILWFPKAAFIVKKCKLGALMSKRCLLGKIGCCVACAVFIFALVALCIHQCAVTVVSFILAFLILTAFAVIFMIEHKDLVKGCIGKVKARLLGKKQVTPISSKEKEDTFGVVEAIPTQEGENRNVGFYRITKGENGKCTFALLYEEGDNLSKEMGVFASEKDAARKINILREKGKGAKAENRVKQTDVDLPAPKFVLDLNAVGEYRYSFLDEDGNVLLQSVSYLNEKRCLKDLKKALVCLTTENVYVDEGKLSEDKIEAVVPTKGFADGEKVKGAEASVEYGDQSKFLTITCKCVRRDKPEVFENKDDAEEWLKNNQPEASAEEPKAEEAPMEEPKDSADESND